MLKLSEIKLMMGHTNKYLLVGAVFFLLSCNKNVNEEIADATTLMNKDFVDSVSGEYTCSCNQKYQNIQLNTSTGIVDTTIIESSYPAHVIISRKSGLTVLATCDTPVRASGVMFINENFRSGSSINTNRYGAYSSADFKSDSMIYTYSYHDDYNPLNYGTVENIVYLCSRKK